MLAADDLARQTLPDHTSKFRRLDFTLPQLFACLVIREMLHLSHRKTETLLRDCMAWLADIGLTHVPDHNTLWHVCIWAAVRMRRISFLCGAMPGDARRSPWRWPTADSTRKTIIAGRAVI